jgi:hypothetical protein
MYTNYLFFLLFITPTTLLLRRFLNFEQVPVVVLGTVYVWVMTWQVDRVYVTVVGVDPMPIAIR